MVFDHFVIGFFRRSSARQSLFFSGALSMSDFQAFRLFGSMLAYFSAGMASYPLLVIAMFMAVR